MNGMMPGTMEIKMNDGFLMTAMGGRVQFYGEEKLSFTKLHETADANSNSIIVENVIERNFNKGAMNGEEFVTSAADDGALNWEVGDQIVIASSSYDYTEQEVRIIDSITDNGDGTSTITLNAALAHRHYGAIETYDAGGSEKSIDMRAEVALLSRNVKIEGLQSQDTDATFGDRANVTTESRQRPGGLSDAEFSKLPPSQVSNGVGGHIMFMPNSGQIIVDGVQLDRMGQSSHKGRYPIHWHLGGDRTGDVFRNSSVTNSNNRGVTIHGTDNLLIENVVLHDIHGHGFFFEDAVETGNRLIGNLVMGVHTVGGQDSSFANPAGKDPFVVDTHDGVLESFARFSSSAAFWITNPTNSFVGNISAGAGDQRTDDYTTAGPAGTGFWYAIPRHAIGEASTLAKYESARPIFAEFGQFDYNSSHTTAIGLNFDRGSDVEDAYMGNADVSSISNENNYEPRTDPNDPSTVTTNFVNGFTNYKAAEAAMYHRGKVETIQFNDLRIADSFVGPWSVSENRYNDSLLVGHSRGNADLDVQVGGPRLYDGSGLFTGTHFAGFGDNDALIFQVEGSSFGPTMYHAFRDTTFDDDGTLDNIAHAVSQFQRDENDPPGHKLGHPYQWIKGVMDLDGTLTSGIGGGVGFSIVPDVDFLVDSGDTELASGQAYLTDDIYARVRIQNKDDGAALFPDDDKSGKPLIRFTAQNADGSDARSVDVVAGQNINEQFYWTQIATKADSSNDGTADKTLVVEFMRQGLPEGGFVLNLDNQDGGRPQLNPTIQDRVDNARLVTKFIGAGNYTPTIGVEVSSEAALRDATEDIAYYRDDAGNLFLNTFITKQPFIELQPGAPLQTAFPATIPTIAFGTTLQAEAFDNGIDGIAYHDSDAVNSQGDFRSNTGVDATETHVAELMDGEWLEYTAMVVPAGYSITVNYSASTDGGQIRVLAGESNSAGFLTELGVIDVLASGSEPIKQANLTFLNANQPSVIRLVMEGQFGADTTIDSITFAEAIQTPFKSHSIGLNADSVRIQLEDFDNGGEGVAYHDTTPGNDTDGNQLRPDEAVDESGGLITNSIFASEWLEYTLDIQPGVYNVTLKKKWGEVGKRVKLFIGEDNSTTDLTELGTFVGVVKSEEEITLENLDLTPWAGSDRVIRIEMLDSFFGLDHLDFVNTTPDQSAPQIELVVINDGSAQRSMVRSLTVAFNEVVQGVDASTFVLTNHTTNTQVVPTVTTEVIDGKTVATLTFSGSEIIGGSLADGSYTLTTLASGLTDAAGNQLDGDGDGTGGDDATDEFFRLFGDSNGDRQVNIVDLFALRDAFIDSMFFDIHNDVFDYDGDGKVNILDVFRFRSRYGKSV